MHSSKQQLERKPEHFLAQPSSSVRGGEEPSLALPPSEKYRESGSDAATAATTLSASSNLSALPSGHGRKRKIDPPASGSSVSSDQPVDPPVDEDEEWSPSSRSDGRPLRRPLGLRQRRPPPVGVSGGSGLIAMTSNKAACDEMDDDDDDENCGSSDESESNSELSDDDDEADQEVGHEHDALAGGMNSNGKCMKDVVSVRKQCISLSSFDIVYHVLQSSKRLCMMSW